MLNRAKFLVNGNCGYVLKPDFDVSYSLQSDTSSLKKQVTYNS